VCAGFDPKNIWPSSKFDKFGWDSAEPQNVR